MFWSGAAHVAAVVAALLYPAPLPEIPPVSPPPVRVMLVAPPKAIEAQPPPPPARQRARLEAPPAPSVRPEAVRLAAVEAPRIELEAKPSLELPLEEPELEAPQPAPQPALEPGPVLAAATAAAPRPEPAAVKAAGFEGAPLQASGQSRKARLNVGAFEGVSGAPGGSPGAGRKADVRQAGFGGALTSNAVGKPGPTVAAGGFGGAVAGVGSQPRRTATASAGFGHVRGERAEVRPEPARSEPNLTPVEILSKPKPVYTAEARERRIEGEVTLRVRFRADGRIEVLEVVRGLGHGLDEAAVRAVEAVQFRPAQRGGVPADSVLSVAVAFRLAY